MITIQTDEGHDHSFEVRPLVQKNLAKLPKGETVVLFVDDENKVTDVSTYARKNEGGSGFWAINKNDKQK